MKMLDLNCDMGESYGHWNMGHDADILPLVSSANIACGYHAGDAHTMHKTVQLALQNNVKIGAHPGLNDLPGFGRRSMPISPDQAYDMVLAQIGSLAAFVKVHQAQLQHVKAHGALYNMAIKDDALAEAIAQAVYDYDPQLTLFFLANSKAIEIAQNIGLNVAHEVFADRTYQDDGSLTSRLQKNAMITDKEQALKQVLEMVENNQVTTVSGQTIPIQADTLCIHGDQDNALVFAQYLNQELTQRGYFSK